MDTYDLITPISEFSRFWLERYWARAGPCCNPPVQTDRYTPRPKRNVILNVGRFFKGSHNKKHIPMIRAFRKLVESGLAGWSCTLWEAWRAAKSTPTTWSA